MALTSVLKKEEIAKAINRALNKSQSYPEYKALVAELAETGGTTGEQKASNINYTLLNNQRMKRWEKTLKLDQEGVKSLGLIKEPRILLVLTESWCGDAAPVLPVVQALANHLPETELRIALRDQHPELMTHFQTEGTVAIPKVILLRKSDREVIGDWGPRPKVLMQELQQHKRENGSILPEFRTYMQNWYNKNKGKDTIAELLGLLGLK